MDAGNSGSGNITLNNSVPLDIAGAINGGGNVTVNNIGAINTTGVIAVPIGFVAITSNSPLTIGSAGITAGSDIGLKATNLTSTGDLTLNGPISSNGAVTLFAANDLFQNSTVFGARGITASAGGSIVFGPLATSSNSPLIYVSGNSPVVAPFPQRSRYAASGDAVLAFSDFFSKVLDNSRVESFITGSDGTTRRKSSSDAIVSEGEICRR